MLTVFLWCLVLGASLELQPASAQVVDSDNDGVPDEVDMCRGTAPGAPVDAAGRPLADLDGDCDVDLDDYSWFEISFTGPSECNPEICDGLDNDCDGMIDELPIPGASTWYRDADGDGFGDLQQMVQTCSAPQDYVSNSEDCNDADPAVYPSALDEPDDTFTDQNCDGTDGTITAAVFVSPFGNDADPGTMASPKKTIQAGIGTALANGKDVYVSMGTYAESVTLGDGVGVFGGYDSSNGWYRAITNLTTITSPTAVAVRGENLTQPTEIQLLRIFAANAVGVTAEGEADSSIGVLVASSTGGLTIQNCDIRAGHGASGLAEGNGAAGTEGGVGGSASGATEGAGGTSACGRLGGTGGAGVSSVASGIAGIDGTGPLGASGGSGGAAGSCSLTSSSNGGNAPPVASPGGAGLPGKNGPTALQLGGLSGSGAYIPPSGGSGAAGTPGSGGGGGGSGGGTANATNFFCDNCAGLSSGAGGGGGGGGCGGEPGMGGRGGGGSFALIVLNSPVVVNQTDMTTAAGGSGGQGGDGGTGGAGGAGGPGAPGQSRGGCGLGSARSAGSGAAGSAGGAGGDGGAGAGGAGGPTICIAYTGVAPPVMKSTQCSLGTPGAGGMGGTGSGGVAPSGPSGIVAALRPM